MKLIEKRKESRTTNTVICILGMHRSGTSCLAGCLEEHGLHLGNVVNSAPFNLKGNKENITLREINDGVLSFSGGSWAKPPERLVWNETFRQRRDDYISNYNSYKIWGFKDPRTLLTLPFWLESKLNMKFVGTFRHPLAVSQSLERRKGLQPILAPLELWKIYNLKLLNYAAEFRFPLVSFDSPTIEYVDNLRALARLFGLHHVSAAGNDFFDERLRSKVFSMNGNEQVDAESMSIYRELLSHTIHKVY